MSEEKQKTGRKTIYTDALGEEIANRLAEGRSLRKICEDDDMPTWRVVLRWASDLSHPFVHHYAWGRAMQAERWADEIVDIADSATSRDDSYCKRLRIDTRKWVAAKLKPEQYGEKISKFLEVVAPKGPEHVLVPAITKAQALELLEQTSKPKTVILGISDEKETEGDVEGSEGDE